MQPERGGFGASQVRAPNQVGILRPSAMAAGCLLERALRTLVLNPLSTGRRMDCWMDGWRIVGQESRETSATVSGCLLSSRSLALDRGHLINGF